MGGLCGIVRMTHLLTLGGQQTTEVLMRTMNWEFEKAERIKRERGELDADEIADAARSGDGDAGRLFDEAGLYLGVALANYINIFNPEMIVLGGGVVTGAGDLFFDHAERITRQLARKEPLKHVRLERAALGDRSGPLGMIAALGDMVATGGVRGWAGGT